MRCAEAVAWIARQPHLGESCCVISSLPDILEVELDARPKGGRAPSAEAYEAWFVSTVALILGKLHPTQACDLVITSPGMLRHLVILPRRLPAPAIDRCQPLNVQAHPARGVPTALTSLPTFTLETHSPGGHLLPPDEHVTWLSPRVQVAIFYQTDGRISGEGGAWLSKATLCHLGARQVSKQVPRVTR